MHSARNKTTRIITLISLLSISLAAQQRENLGPLINSQYDELLPVISADGRTLFFDRKGSPENIDGDRDDIWFSELGTDSQWVRAQNIGAPLNNAGYNYVCSVMPDENVLLLGNRYIPSAPMQIGVSMSRRMNGRWTFPSNLSINNFKNLAPESEYSLSPDGNVLIMSINPVDSSRRDLYVSFKIQGTHWSEPQNIGTINTEEFNEITPFIAADGRTLYFASDRPGGTGDFDMYMTTRTDDTWMFWTKPQNLGSEINTREWDAYYTVPASGEYAYFVSTAGSMGGTDIFRIKIPDRLKPKPVIIVRGRVMDPLLNPLGASILYERLADAKTLGTAYSDDLTGKYQIALPAGMKYGFRAEKSGYVPVNENIDLTDVKAYSEVERDLILVPIEKGKTVRLNNIFFEFDKAVLTTDSRAELDRLVELLAAQPDMSIEIRGHTDNAGAPDYNLRLSQSRAQAVVDYLIQKSIATGRLSAKGYGETKPEVSNATEEGRAKNRRVEFTIQ